MRRLRTYLLFGAKAAISLALLYLAVRLVNFEALRGRLDRLNYIWFAAALTVIGAQTVLVSLRWQRIAEFCGAHITRRRAVLFTFIGVFFSQVLPSTVGGDAARIWLLARDAGAWKGPIYSVLIDRIAGIIWLAVLVLIFLPWSLALIRNPIGRTTLILIGAAGAAAPVGLLVLSRIGRTPIGQSKPIGHLADIATVTWKALSSGQIGAPIAIISIVVQLLTVLVLWFCAQAVGSPFTLLDSMLLMPPVILIAAVPVSIAGWGVRESAMLAAFTYAGLPDSDGVLVSIIFGVSLFIIGALGGIVWILSANRVRLASIQEASEHTMDV